MAAAEISLESPYTAAEREAIALALGDDFDAEIMLEIDAMALAIRHMRPIMRNESIADRIADLERKAIGLEAAAETLASDDLQHILSVRGATGEADVRSAVQSLRDVAGQVRAHIALLRTRPAARRGRVRPADPALLMFLRLWCACDRPVGRYNGTVEFLEAVAMPIIGEMLKPTTVEHFVRAQVERAGI